MERIQKTFEIAVPAGAAYDQWTHFEEFPRFMDGVLEVRQIDARHIHWRATLAGSEREWDAEITEQVPERVIAWRSTSGVPNAGVVRFEPLTPESTRISLEMEYEPQTAVERLGDALGVVSRQLDRTIEDFSDYVEKRGK
jgi:uncharacterized membrane protein